MITHHHDGHGLNDEIIIDCDARDPDNGNASHHYSAGPGEPGVDDATVHFQQGPRGEPGSIRGCTDAVLLAIVLDRYEGFQSGDYACCENALVITKLQEALHWMKHRADDRSRRGVLGKNKA